MPTAGCCTSESVPAPQDLRRRDAPGWLPVAPAVMPTFAVLPVAMAIPVAVARVEHADGKPSWADGDARSHDGRSRPVGAAVSIGTAVEPASASVGRVGGRDRAERQTRGDSRQQNLLEH